MERIIRRANFRHDNSDTRDKFDDEIREWDTDNGKLQDVSGGLKALAQKLTEKTFPEYDTEGSKQAELAFDEIHRISRRLIDEGESPSKFHPIYLEFTMKLMEFGPATVHMVILKELLSGSDVEFGQSYVKVMKGKELARYVKALCQILKMKEKIQLDDFNSSYESYFRDFLEILTEEQMKIHMKDLMDLGVRFYLDFTNEEEELFKQMDRNGDHVFDALEDPWTKMTDIPSLKSYINRVAEVIRQAKFPQNSSVKKEIGRFVDKMFEKLGKRGLAEELHENIFDMVLVISKSPHIKVDPEYVYRLMGDTVTFFRRLPEKSIKNKPELFKAASKRYVSVVEQLDVKFMVHTTFVRDVMEDLLIHAFGDNKQLARPWLELLVPLLKRPCIQSFRASREVLDKDKAFKWKDHVMTAQMVFEALTAITIPEEDDDGYNEKTLEEYVNKMTYVMKCFLDGLKKSRMMKDFAKGCLHLVIQLLETRRPELFDLAQEVADKMEVNMKDKRGTVMEVMKRLHKLLKDTDFPWDEYDARRAADEICRSCFRSVKDAKVFKEEDLVLLCNICATCLEFDCLDPETGQMGSSHYLIFIEIIQNLGEWLSRLNRFDLATAIVPGILKTMEEDDEQVQMLGATYLTTFGDASSGIQAVAPYLDNLIKLYLDKEEPHLLRTINTFYPANPKVMKNHFRDLMTLFKESTNLETATWMAQVFHQVSKKQAELFTAEDTKLILKRAKEDSQNQATLLMIIQELATRRPDLVLEKVDMIMDRTGWNPMFYSWINQTMGSLGAYSKKSAPKILDYLFSNLKVNQDKANLLTALSSIRMVGFKYPELLKARRADIESLQLMDSDAMGVKQTLLDMVDNKTPQSMLDQLKEQQEDLDALVGRVDETEEAVVELKDDVSKQGQKLDNVKNDVKEQGQRLGKVEGTVDETVAKVEEIDSKTLSHAPYWSRDVSKLLNPKSEHDWRLLSSRLGYSNTDIRAWAQQADPCMAMLNEWYTTRKTSEASMAVLNALIEMNRLDAARIVENAMKNAEAVVEDEEFEYASPPPIFISYQWGHQNEVKLLHRHLEMAGYVCWLDVGQMGGGDKLFEKIDKGIRAAKVVISCVTEKYAKSPNCNREVNLSVNLNKPIIPLLLEQCNWPPPGSMGPIFSEYLFIRFFRRAEEELKGEPYWEKEKFQELLMQLNTLGLPPEESKIQPVYRNWWMPVVEDIKIDKRKPRNAGQASKPQQSEADKKAVQSPDVFISYQWGKQKNIIQLYERLTSLGLSCWLDIKQMGGGDSLYDKIDRGLRGSKVVLSCVTQKYALSANCRREVSLADALHKPLLPLLLEKMTWPPTGPMGLVMTQLLYIDFTQEKVQQTWEGPQFEELRRKLNDHVPPAKAGSSRKGSVDTKTDPSTRARNPVTSKPAETGRTAASRQAPSQKAAPSQRQVPSQSGKPASQKPGDARQTRQTSQRTPPAKSQR